MFPVVHVIVVGALGVVAGIIGNDAIESSESPLIFVATTVNVYGIPFARPLVVVELLVDIDVNPPGLLVTVYFVIVEPPFDIGADQYIVASVFPGVPKTLVGSSGTVEGIIADDAIDADELPIILIATTVNVYDVPFVRPDIVAVVVKPSIVDADRPPGLLETV